MKDAGRFLLTVAMAVALSVPALAEEGAGARGGAAPANAERTHRPNQGMGKAPNPERFAERKANAIKRISGRIESLEKKKACVEASSSPETMGACFPNKGKRMLHRQDGAGDSGPPAAGGQKE